MRRRRSPRSPAPSPGCSIHPRQKPPRIRAGAARTPRSAPRTRRDDPSSCRPELTRLRAMALRRAGAARTRPAGRRIVSTHDEPTSRVSRRPRACPWHCGQILLALWSPYHDGLTPMFCGAANLPGVPNGQPRWGGSGYSETREPQAERRREPVVWATTCLERHRPGTPVTPTREAGAAKHVADTSPVSLTGRDVNALVSAVGGLHDAVPTSADAPRLRAAVVYR